MSIEIRDIDIKIENFYQLKVTCDVVGENLQYAYYLYCEDDIVEKGAYTNEGTFEYNLQKPGIYRVRVFIRDKSKETIAFTTNRMKFQGFYSKEIITEPEVPIVIFGVSKKGAAVKSILDTRKAVKYFVDVDDQKWDKIFFGIKIIGIHQLKEIGNFKMIVADHFTEGTKLMFDTIGITDYEIFDFNLVSHNYVIKKMVDMSITELHEISKFCYENGLQEGANFTEKYIHFRYNSVIPYTAEIGKGTRFAYGGIGVVMHAKAVIGENCVIGQNVTIESKEEIPIKGNDVFIASGAKCIGGKIGDNVIIEANAVITKDIPSNCVVAGVPAKIISTEVSKYKVIK